MVMAFGNGLGAGVNQVSIDTVGNLRDNRGATFTADDDSVEFAAQAIAGLAWAVGDRANIDLTYRYLTGDANFASTTAGTEFTRRIAVTIMPETLWSPCSPWWVNSTFRQGSPVISTR